jgi:AraC-like DNA-binding protein
MLCMDTTSTVTPQGGFDHWHQVTCRNFSLSECGRTTSPAFRARIASRAFGPLVLSDAFQTESVRMTRGPTEIRKDQRDHFMLYLVMEGRIDVTQDDRQTSASAGDLFLYDQTSPFSLDFHHPHAILVNVPRALLVSRVPKVRRLTARRISGASKMGALAGSIVRQMSDFDDATRGNVADRLAASAVDILATTLESELAGDENLQKERHRLLPKVESYILAHLHEDGLDLESIARAQNIAPRTLNRIFAAEGTTPIRWLWQQRLAASYRALSEGRVDNVTDAALSSGFTDMSHFSRAFKREFGRLPHLVQRSHPIRSGRT